MEELIKQGKFIREQITPKGDGKHFLMREK